MRVVRQWQNDGREPAARGAGGEPFQVWTAVTGNARLPIAVCCRGRQKVHSYRVDVCRRDLEVLKSTINDGRMHAATQKNASLIPTEEKLNKLNYDLSTAAAQVAIGFC